jgi:ubiquinone/menaquinone biosynthesis C-methylase UbiE
MSNRKLGRFQIHLWTERAEYEDLRSILDPNDRKGLRNRYMDLAQKISMNRAINFSPEDKVLDFGCGIGRLAFWVASKGPSVIGIDVSKQPIAVAEKNKSDKKTNITFKAYDGLNIPFEEETFDKVISAWVWQHILNPEDFQATVKEVCRVLKKGGKICFIETVAKVEITPKDFAEDYVIRRTQQEYIKEFEKNGCRFIKSQLINARGRGLFYRLLCLNFTPKFLMPLIPLFVKFDLFYTRKMDLQEKGSVDCLFVFEK